MARITKDPEERKAEIMDTAEGLFSEKGFNNVAVSEIVKKLGVAQGTFYYYFNSKEDLLNQTLERRLDGIMKSIGLLAGRTDMNALQKLHNMLKAALFSGIGRQNMTEHMDNSRDNEMHRRLEEKFYSRFYPMLLEVIGQGVKDGQFTLDSPKEVTQILLLGIQGYMHVIFPELKDSETVNLKMKAIEEVITKVLGLKNGSLQLKI